MQEIYCEASAEPTMATDTSSSEFSKVEKRILVAIDFVASIMFSRWADIPRGGSMWGPTFTDTGFFMGNDFGTEWSNGCSIEVECSM